MKKENLIKRNWNRMRIFWFFSLLMFIGKLLPKNNYYKNVLDTWLKTFPFERVVLSDGRGHSISKIFGKEKHLYIDGKKVY